MTMPTFDGKSEKLEQFEDLIQASLKIHYSTHKRGQNQPLPLSHAQ